MPGTSAAPAHQRLIASGHGRNRREAAAREIARAPRASGSCAVFSSQTHSPPGKLDQRAQNNSSSVRGEVLDVGAGDLDHVGASPAARNRYAPKSTGHPASAVDELHGLVESANRRDRAELDAVPSRTSSASKVSDARASWQSEARRELEPRQSRAWRQISRVAMRRRSENRRASRCLEAPAAIVELEVSQDRTRFCAGWFEPRALPCVCGRSGAASPILAHSFDDALN